MKATESRPWQRWYGLAVWQKLRKLRLASEPLCRMCEAENRSTTATVCDHVTPHRGDWALFADYDNTQSLCASHHNHRKQSEERTGYSKAVGADGYPIDPRHPFNASEVRTALLTH